MNERIRELASKCWDQRLDGAHFDQEKFARLIIKDCDQYARRYWEHGELLGGDLKRHFGVEDS